MMFDAIEAEADSFASPVAEPDFHISHVRRSGGFSMDTRHSHDRHEIYWLVSGERNYFVRDRVFRIGTGDIVVVAAGDFHKTSNVGTAGHERVLIEFSESFLDGSLGEDELKALMEVFPGPSPVIDPDVELRPGIESLFARLLEEEGEDRRLGTIMRRAMLVELLVLLARARGLSGDGDERHPDASQRRISEICRHMAENSSGKLSLSGVAKRFGISPSHLSRVFQKVTGVHFVAFLSSLRLKEARRLLVETSLPISLIAEEAGFSSATCLGRVFHARFGMSPRDYRRLNRDRAVPAGH